MVDPDGPAAGKLAINDRVFEINGSASVQKFGLPGQLIAAGQAYRVRVTHAGSPKEFLLPVSIEAGTTWLFLGDLLVVFIDLLLASVLLLAGPQETLARVTYLLILGVALTITVLPFEAFEPVLPPLLASFATLCTTPIWKPVEWALLFDFALRFPEQLPQPRLLLQLRRLLYISSCALVACGLPLIVAEISGRSSNSFLLAYFPLSIYNHWRPILVGAQAAATLFATPLLLYFNYRRIPSELERRKLRWVGLGTGLSALPLGLGVLMRLVLDLLPGSHPIAVAEVESFRDTFGTFGTVLVPISITYAIVRHRLLGIRLTIRRGVQYLLARNVLRVILSLPLLLAGVYVLRHSNEPLRQIVLQGSLRFNLALAAAAAASLHYRKPLARWVDRRFFRSAYDEEVILTDLVEGMQRCESADDLARTVAERLQDTFQPSSVCVLFQRQAFDRTTVIYPQQSELAIEFCCDEQRGDEARTLALVTDLSGDLDERCSKWETLHPKSRATVVGTSQGKPVGVLLLGPKMSEQAYDKRDIKLLAMLAVQIGLVVEVLSLKSQVRDDERVRVEVLGRLDHQDIQLVMECPSCGRCYERPSLKCRVDDSVLEMTLPMERVVEGKYRLERRIGAGGMGVVYAASDLRLRRMVALKVITGRLFGNTQALRRFEREARTIAALHHPNIVSVFDFGLLPGGGAYIVMQLVNGHSWRTELQQRGALEPARAALWFDQLCDAVACAHDAEVLHRDLKPENVLTTGGGHEAERITVLDFGLAKYFGGTTADPSISFDGHAIGTHGYMSPEQRRGGQVDHHTDLYSLGVLVAEVLSGVQPPMTGASLTWVEDVLKQSSQAAGGGEAWRALTALAKSCLADSPLDRPQDVRTLRRELVGLLRACPPPVFLGEPKADGGAPTLSV